MNETVLNRIRMVTLRVSSLSASEQWYTAKLGLRVIWRNESMVCLQPREPWGTVIVLVAADSPGRFERESAVHFTTRDIQKAHDKVRQSGVYLEPIRKSGPLSAFCYRDSSGQPTILWSPDPAKYCEDMAIMMARFAPAFA